MLTAAARRLSRVLSIPVAQIGSPSEAVVVSLQRWFHDAGPRQDQLDEFGIATGYEREELEYKKDGKVRFDSLHTPPRGPMGTKTVPFIIESHYDVRIIECSGGIGEDEHNTIWYLLEKGKVLECFVCSQFFQLKVIGVGGEPGSDEH